MNQKVYLNVMLILSMLFGALVAVLAIFHLGNVGTVAVIGGIILAIGWALTGIVPKKSDTSR
ncbi:hypothetical protein HII36_13585 [Nonomuraea sp. NN258]|uniref:hypothetical protein n=1 Tax=Nonomuraea antri TaxID=2730852 RepID=UPI00156862BB|nr:hypothetical protein [Nonomuraea antri]NRQ32865.1 hypothetical protein [Nonomuraea antri]